MIFDPAYKKMHFEQQFQVKISPLKYFKQLEAGRTVGSIMSGMLYLSRFALVYSLAGTHIKMCIHLNPNTFLFKPNQQDQGREKQRGVGGRGGEADKLR